MWRVVVETLNVSGMIRNRKLARAIADAGMSDFLSKLEYKCGWYGAEFVKADRWFASSKLCAHCGRIMLSMIAMARPRDDDLMRRCVDAYAHKRIDMIVR